MQSIGREKVVYLDGRSFLELPIGLSEDLGHPSAIGMECIAKRLEAMIRSYGLL